MALRAVLFDFGHTLFDVRDPGELVSRTAAELGSEVDPERAARVWDSISRAAVRPEELDRQRDISGQAHKSNWVRLLSPLEEFAQGLAEAVYHAHVAVENWAPYSDSGNRSAGRSAAKPHRCDARQTRRAFCVHL